MPKPPTCECGECLVCARREYMAEWRRRNPGASRIYNRRSYQRAKAYRAALEALPERRINATPL